jgi:hypothetical protein
MTYAGERAVFDADSHLMAMPDFLSAHADAASRALLPPLNRLNDGQFDPGALAGRRGHAPETVAELLELGDPRAEVACGAGWCGDTILTSSRPRANRQTPASLGGAPTSGSPNRQISAQSV